MTKKFSVEAVVEEAPKSLAREPNTQVIRDRLVRFTFYEGTPLEIQDSLKAAVIWYIANQMSSGHLIKVGERYEINRTV